MRIYYEPKANPDIPELRGLPEYPGLIEKISEFMSGLADEAQMHLAQKAKYRLMWELRAFEKEIEEDGGCFIIKAEPYTHIETKEIDADLMDKIRPVLNAIDWNRW